MWKADLFNFKHVFLLEFCLKSISIISQKRKVLLTPLSDQCIPAVSGIFFLIQKGYIALKSKNPKYVNLSPVDVYFEAGGDGWSVKLMCFRNTFVIPPIPTSLLLSWIILNADPGVYEYGIFVL